MKYILFLLMLVIFTSHSFASLAEDFTHLEISERSKLIEIFRVLSGFPECGWHNFKGENSETTTSKSSLELILPPNWTRELEVKFSLEDLLALYEDEQITELIQHSKSKGCLGLTKPNHVFWEKRKIFLNTISKKDYNCALEWQYFIFPVEFYYWMTQYKIVRLNGAALTALPRLPECNKLVEIDLSCNLFRAFPQALQSLPHLQILNFGHNNIQSVPKWIEDFKKLLVLILSHNQLKEVPEHIRALKTLKTLDLSYNQIEVGPNNIGDLKDLEKLNVSDNRIKTPFVDPSNLPRLKKLMLHHNDVQLTDLPITYLMHPSLEYITINDQPSQERRPFWVIELDFNFVRRQRNASAITVKMDRYFEPPSFLID